MKITFYGDVDAKRAAAMPSVQRQLMVMWEALDEMQAFGAKFSTDVKYMIAEAKAVQKKYPSPPEESE